MCVLEIRVTVQYRMLELNINEVASDYRKARTRRITCCVHVALYEKINVHSCAAVG